MMKDGKAVIVRRKKGKRLMRVVVRFVAVVPKHVKVLSVACSHTAFHPVDSLQISVRRRSK